MRGSDDYRGKRPGPPSGPPPGAGNSGGWGQRDQPEDSEYQEDSNAPETYSEANSETSNKYDDQSARYREQPSVDKPRIVRPASRSRLLNPDNGDSEQVEKGARRPAPRGSNKVKGGELRDDEKKDRNKRLRTLLSNQAICLAIIFALIAGFNWMSADYSGEYISQDPKMGLVRLSLVRQPQGLEGELAYGGATNMEMQKNEPKGDQTDLTFVSTEPELISRGLIVRSRFIGSVDSSYAEGVIVDAKGTHNVKLTKNIVASLFKLLQTHTPNVQMPRPPKLFQVPDVPPQAPLPGESDSTKPFTYGGSTTRTEEKPQAKTGDYIPPTTTNK